MGWLGYTEQQTAATRLPLLERAHAAHCDKMGLFIKGLMGGFGGDAEAAPAEPPSAEQVMGQMRSIFGGNAQKPQP